MKHHLEDLIWLIISVVSISALIIVIVFAVNSGREWSARVKQVETSTGCEYLGSAKDASQVGFFDCDGVIETKRIK